MLILYVTLGLLAIGMIIFIHEAGHFLAAKKVGVRVDRFALGFDPPSFFSGPCLRGLPATASTHRIVSFVI